MLDHSKLLIAKPYRTIFLPIKLWEKINLSQKFLGFIEKICNLSENYHFFLHGGALRDLLIHAENPDLLQQTKISDWDFKTTVPGTVLQSYIGNIEGLERADSVRDLFRMTIDEVDYEIFCVEPEPKQSLEDTLLTSAMTADFTANSLMLQIIVENNKLKFQGAIIDFLGGTGDLIENIIIPCEDYKSAFGQQEKNESAAPYRYSRIFRLVNLVAKDFPQKIWYIDGLMREEIKQTVKNNHRIYKTSKAVLKQFCKGLTSGYGEAMVLALNNFQIAEYIFPNYFAVTGSILKITALIDTYKKESRIILILGELYTLIFWPSFLTLTNKFNSKDSPEQKIKDFLNEYCISLDKENKNILIVTWKEWLKNNKTSSFPRAEMLKFLDNIKKNNEKLSRNNDSIREDRIEDYAKTVSNSVDDLSKNETLNKSEDTKTTILENPSRPSIDQKKEEGNSHHSSTLISKRKPKANEKIRSKNTVSPSPINSNRTKGSIKEELATIFTPIISKNDSQAVQIVKDKAQALFAFFNKNPEQRSKKQIAVGRKVLRAINAAKKGPQQEEVFKIDMSPEQLEIEQKEIAFWLVMYKKIRGSEHQKYRLAFQDNSQNMTHIKQASYFRLQHAILVLMPIFFLVMKRGNEFLKGNNQTKAPIILAEILITAIIWFLVFATLDNGLKSIITKNVDTLSKRYKDLIGHEFEVDYEKYEKDLHEEHPYTQWGKAHVGTK